MLFRSDPQLAHRGHWVTLRHPEMGDAIYNAAPYRFRRMSGAPRTAAPLLGQHTEVVLTGLLGMSRDEVQALADSGALK